MLDVMANLSRGIERGRTETLTKAGLVGKGIHAAEISRATGGDSVLSGFNQGKGGRVGARFDVRPGPTPYVVLRATGPMQLIERDTDGHVIRSRRLTGRGRRGFVGPTLPGQFRRRRGIGPQLRAVIDIPGIGYRYSARHRGTKGKHPWEKGKKRARPAMTRVIRRNLFNVVRRSARP